MGFPELGELLLGVPQNIVFCGPYQDPLNFGKLPRIRIVSIFFSIIPIYPQHTMKYTVICLCETRAMHGAVCSVQRLEGDRLVKDVVPSTILFLLGT